MSLLDQSIDPPIRESRKFEQLGLAQLFARSAAYELHQSAYGLAQTIALEGLVGKGEEPEPADGQVEKLAQMLGRGVGDFIPTVAVAAAARFGFSRLLPEAAAAENLMLKRSAIGLSVAESATTGAIGGAVFKPSDQATASDWRSLAIDRAQAGAAGALSFGALTLGTLGWNRIAGQAWVERLGADKVLKSSIVSGLASGVPGGLANAEINSLLSDGKFTTDGATIGKAMGEMAIMGGLFGATTSGLALLGRAGRSALSGNLSAARESETLLSENVPGSHKSHLQFAQTASALSITYDEASPDPKLFDTETARSILPKPSFRQRLLSQAFEQDATASAALLVNQSDIASVHATFGSESSISKLLLKVTSAPVLREIVKAGREDPLEMRRVLQAFEDAGVENLPLRQRNLLDYIHLSRRLGDDAPLRAELFRRIDTRAAIDDVGSFLDDGVDNRKFLKSILDAGVENLNLNLWALQKLGSQLNGDPKLMVRLSQLQSFEFNLKDVHEIIENDRLRNPQLLREFLADESRKPGQQSTEALKKYINDRKIAKYFSGDADFIAALKETDTAYWGHSSAITTLSYFLDKDPVKHPEIVRRLVLSHAKIRDLTQENLGNLTRIFERVGGDDDLFERIAGREAPSKLSALAEFIDEDPAAHKALLDRIVRKDSLRTSELNPDRLRALVSLDREFGADSPTMTRILEIDPLGSIGNDMSLIGIADFLGRDPSRKALVEKLVKSHADAGYFSKTHLQGMLDVSEHFAVDSPVFNKLLKLSSYTTQPDKLASFLAGEFESQQHEPLQALAQRRSLAAKVLSDDNPTRLTVDGERLQGLLDLNRMFGEDSLTMRNILVMEYGPSLKLPAMAAFASTNTGRLFISKIVSDPNLDIWAPSHTAFLSPILAALDARLKPDAAMAARLVALVGTDVDFSALSRFLEDKPARSQIVADVLRDSDGTKRLTVPNLLDIEALRSLQPYFAATPAVMPYLERLQKNGLSATRIAEFVADRPESRSKTVEELVRANADIRRFNDQMRLMVLPDNIASRLVDSSAAGGMRVAEIVGLLKDWSYGRQFMEQLITHVEGGNPTTEGDLRALANGARQLPASGSDKVIQSATSLRQPSPETSALAETLRHTAERLAEVSPAGKPIVLLGRDTAPLLPLLRDRGLNAQYFLWGRGNGKDLQTFRQWFKEVPPDALVVDSGFGGSVINWIRERDQSASGMLMSANQTTPYQQLLRDSDHHDRVEALEKLIKSIPRSKTYTESGGAKLVDKSDSDGPVAQKRSRTEGTNRWSVEAQIRDVLRASGLPEWYVWRYSQFTGLTPQERLGLSTTAQVAEHYRQVEQLRQAQAASAL